jgi:hypothetical protein
MKFAHRMLDLHGGFGRHDSTQNAPRRDSARARTIARRRADRSAPIGQDDIHAMSGKQNRRFVAG